MYDINTRAVYAHKTVMANPVYRARVERVVAGLTEPREIITYRDDQLQQMLDAGLKQDRVAMGTLPEVHDPILVFNTFRFEESPTDVVPDLGGQLGCSLRGSGAFVWAGYNQPGDPHAHDKVCRPCWRIHLENGCLQRCLYCGLGGVLVSMVNIEEYCEQLDRLMEANPWQKTFLLDDDADPPGLEPELGCLGHLIEHFGAKEDRYLIIHTKTWNTEWMRGLKHNGNTIPVWSISGPTQSRVFEPNTGTTEQRIAAARVADEAGYPVRYKFKPIIPVRNWREEASQTIERIFAETNPDVISMCCFMWMDVDEMKRCLAPGLDALDPDFLRVAEKAHEAMAEFPRTRPFPFEAREEIYAHHIAEIRRHSDIPISLSTENWDMWKRFGEELGASATNYQCACGPQAVPGLQKLDGHAFRDATRCDGGVPCTTNTF